MNPLKSDAEIIEELGGTYAVADLCKVKPPSVSEWKKSGIPSARRQYLELLKPEIFNQPNPTIPPPCSQPGSFADACSVHGD
jgi:hypothetical protein